MHLLRSAGQCYELKVFGSSCSGALQKTQDDVTLHAPPPTCTHMPACTQVIVSMSEINWTKKGTNPIDCVGFFDSYDDTEKREVHAHQITSMMPSEFQVRDWAGCWLV